MDTLLNREIQEKPTNLSKLNVIIHPLYRSEPFESKFANRFATDRDSMSLNITRRMMPTNDHEATLVMPMVNRRGESDLKRNLERLKGFPEYTQWTDFYKELVKANGGRGKNIILGTDLISDETKWAPDVDSIKQDLLKRKMIITSETEVVVGGELLNACLFEGVQKLLSLSEIDKLKVDKKCVLTTSYLFDSPHESVESDLSLFVWQVEKSGLKIESNDEYYTISTNKVLNSYH